MKTGPRGDLQKKYRVREKGVKCVMEVRRYKERIKQLKQNRLFEVDQSKLYQEINGEERSK